MQTRTVDGTAKPKERHSTQKTSGAVVPPPNEFVTHAPRDLPDVLAIRHQQIATAAYLLAEKRGFSPGSELEDWLAAEQEIDEKARHF